MIQVYLVDVTQLVDNKYNEYLKFLTPSDLDKINSFVFLPDRKRLLLGRMLLLNYFKRNHSIIDILTILEKNPYGKPFLRNSSHKFNISHSGDYCVCCFGDCEVGIDIEQVKEINTDIADLFLCKNEVRYIREVESLKRFYEIWTKKEALLKCQGAGLARGLKTYDMTKIKEDGILNCHEGSFFFKKYEIDDYIMCICSNYNTHINKLVRLNPNALL